ncbi:MAG: hypothetical protein AUJ51_10040 [Elusimicrobia bacterium CG1_02_56_21]|nr:MAG: hypothetical protein AUJ51_10040 [Elusimicrobia bacterium CG1_02_56_21]
MKYWFYSEGNILGPYDPAEMLALPAFAEESLVCPETATGDNPGDWRPASQVAEIASALSFGSGRTITAGVVAGAYEYETGFNSSARYFEDKEPSTGANYGELLDTIDNILGAYKEGPSARAVPETDYDLAEKFDIRLSHIQEELEAARWEKNLLLEKIRTKEMEDKKNRARIEELEARLKGEHGKVDAGAKELEQVRHLAALNENAETIRQIEEIKREERELREEISESQNTPPAPEAPPAPAAPVKKFHALKPETISEAPFKDEGLVEEEKPEPVIEAKTFKSISRGSRIKMETSLGKELKGEAEDLGLTSRKFKSLGQTQAPAYVYGSHYDKPLPGPEAAPPGAYKPEAVEPLPQQAGGIVYDFTVVTSKKPDTQQFQIETRYEAPVYQAQPAPVQAQPQPVKQPVSDLGMQQPAPAPAQQPAPVQAPQLQQGFQFQTGAQSQSEPAAPAKAAEPQSFSPAAQYSPAPLPEPREKAPAAAADSPDTTQRIPVPSVKVKPEVKGPERPRKKGGRTAFFAILVIFGSIAAGGLGYFFMGEGVSFSEFSMLNLGGKKKPATLDSQFEAKEEPAPAAVQAEPEVEPQPAPAPAAAEKPANDNIKKALEIVKGYKLSGGRGNVATWFSNSFLSGGANGASEEWTATPLHGDILVVQYRLLRPRQEPLIYQFEVDSAKQDIVRGINNNAIELLDFSSKKKSASAAPVRKPAARPKPRKASRPAQIPILPLPEAPDAGMLSEEDPTGFENAQAEGSEQVKYLKAQESDEELF